MPNPQIVFLRSQLFVTPKKPTARADGMTIVVTGANVGLGKEAARHFVSLGAANVILACRTVSKGEEAKREIESSTKRSNVIQVWQLDLENYDSVKSFAKKLGTLERLDVLCENAGKATEKFSRDAYGVESTISVNVIGTFLLAMLALPTLRRTARKYNVDPVLSIVASEVHGFTSFEERKKASPKGSILDVLNDEKLTNMGERYPVSKLLVVLCAREMAAKIKDSNKGSNQHDVILNYVNPGLCHSQLGREGSMVLEIMKFLLARTTEVGSRTLVDASLQHGSESHGHYVSDCKLTHPAKLVEGPEGPELQRRIWEEVSGVMDKIQPGIAENLGA